MHSTEELLEIYLLKYRRCPILHVGTLELTDLPASASMAERVIYPPVQTVKLVSDVLDNTDLVQFIANRREVTSDKVLMELSGFSKELKFLIGKEEREMPSIGSFFVAADGFLDFRASEKIFEPGKPVPAEWVIHPAASHNMKVGDKETNSVEMTELLRNRDISQRQWWWIAALLIALVSAGLIGYYYSNPHPTVSGGNATPISIKPSTPTYTTE